jgi:hypothetical protein
MQPRCRMGSDQSSSNNHLALCVLSVTHPLLVGQWCLGVQREFSEDVPGDHGKWRKSLTTLNDLLRTFELWPNEKLRASLRRVL